MKILLYDLTQPALIIPRKTGITYSNQVDGTSCKHRELEGFLIPIDYDYRLENGKESLSYALCSLFTEDSASSITKETAEKIQNILNLKSGISNDIEVNWNKLDASCEAWLHVKITGDLFGLFKEKHEIEAVLTWPNSD